VKQLVCIDKMIEQPDLCRPKCPTPCEEYDYTPSINVVPWPHISAQLSVYKTFIEATTRFGNKFDEYKYLHQSEFNTNQSAGEDLLQQLDQKGLIRDSFLQLNIEFDDNSYIKQIDVEAFPIDALGAQVGGVLALWLGVTVMVIFEIFEVIVSVIWAGCRAKRNKEPSSEGTIEYNM